MAIDVQKLLAFQQRYSDMIGQGIVDGLLSPTTPTTVPGLGLHAEGGNYLQEAGPYSQSTGGDHSQTGGGGYTQAPAPKVE